jgi:hypothetical protein
MIARRENQPMTQPTNEPPAPELTVWHIYKSRFLYTQAFIIVACGAVFLFRRNPTLTVTVFFFLQLTAVYGSWMGKRMVEQINSRAREDQQRHNDAMNSRR